MSLEENKAIVRKFVEISRRFQTTLPKEVRDKLDVAEDDKVVWLEKDNEIVVRKA